ncbi:MAG: CCA tRNA nucleotidyltransferase [Anaerolineae bacterium]|nr:CCA tRNA nucleotidyltransferase [Anaerolineae bacterium]
MSHPGTPPPAPHAAPRPLHWPDFLPALHAALADEATSIYLVGGIVRDAFWGIPAHDVDLVVPDNAFQIARHIANQLEGAFYKLDPERETGRAIVMLNGKRTIIDVASYRGSTLLEDLTGRDFTLNAVAAPLTANPQEVIDPLDGLADAGRRILRRCSPDSIRHDPVRALRAVRLATRFRLRIEPATLADIRQEGPRLAAASPERLRDEFITMLGSRRPAAGLRALDALDLLPLILPEVTPMKEAKQNPPHHADVWNHTLQVVEALEGVLDTIGAQRTDNTAAQAGLGMIVYYLDTFRTSLQEYLATAWPNERQHRALLMLAALLHASDTPAQASERASVLRLSRGEIDRVEAIARHRLRPHALARQGEISRREIYRFWRDTDPAGLDVCLLALAEYLATAGPRLVPNAWSAYLLRIKALLAGKLAADEQNVCALPSLLTGHDVIRVLKLKSGPAIGELIEAVREAQAEGLITTREEALTFLKEQHNRTL